MRADVDGSTTLAEETDFSGSFSVAFRTDLGAVRDNNQDSAWATTCGDHALLAVADGMGGHKGGADASKAAMNLLRRELEQQDLTERRDMKDIFEQVSVSVTRAAPDGGTTLVAAIVGPLRIDVWHVGDSRAYVLREGSLVPVTLDHSWVQALVNDGRLTPEQAAHHPRRNVLLRAIGKGRESTPDHSSMRFIPGDVVLLCSDGLHGVVSEQEIAELLGSDEEADLLASRLIDAALRRGAPDNVAVAVARWVADGAA